jgi:aryl-alcohol dehydrogenase-like predicted oxidoreductase
MEASMQFRRLGRDGPELSVVGVICHSPLPALLLTGTFDAARARDLPADDWCRASLDFQEPALSANLELARRLDPVAERHGVSVAAVAVAWVIAQSGVTGAIVGVRRPSQVDGWLPAVDLRLGDDDLEEIPRVVVETGAGGG